jgi:uncharacterized surface protein with fasciclin (FAS1) repeats
LVENYYCKQGLFIKIKSAKNKENPLKLTDEKGGSSYITIADVFQKNGVIHVIDTVAMPN